MRTVTVSFFVAVMLIAGCTGSKNADFESTPEGTKKIISYNYFEPIITDSELLCGERYMGEIDCKQYIDKDGDVLLEHYYNNAGELTQSIKYEYISAPKRKLRHKVMVYDELSKYQEANYIRDANNNLLEIKISGKKDNIYLVGDNYDIEALKCEYDDTGKRVKEITSSSTVYIQRPPSSSNTEIIIESEYDSEGYLKEKTTSFYDKKTDKLIRRIKEQSEYDHLISRTENTFTYNAAGKEIKETEVVESIYGQQKAIWRNVNATRKEMIEEDIRTFGSGLKKDSNSTYLFEYDQFGNETSMEWWDDWSRFASSRSKSGRKQIYTYNSKGDWIQDVFYQNIDGYLTPQYICLRTITYL
jgi:hypothetical protein